MDIFRILEFNQAWIDLGIITPAKLKQLEVAWAIGEDTNTEHFTTWEQMTQILRWEAL